MTWTIIQYIIIFVILGNILYRNGFIEGISLYNPETPQWMRFSRDIKNNVERTTVKGDGSTIYIVRPSDYDTIPEISPPPTCPIFSTCPEGHVDSLSYIPDAYYLAEEYGIDMNNLSTGVYTSMIRSFSRRKIPGTECGIYNNDISMVEDVIRTQDGGSRPIEVHPNDSHDTYKCQYNDDTQTANWVQQD